MWETYLSSLSSLLSLCPPSSLSLSPFLSLSVPLPPSLCLPSSLSLFPSLLSLCPPSSLSLSPFLSILSFQSLTCSCLYFSTADGEFHCASLATYQTVNIGIPRLKGCSCFAVDWHKLRGDICEIMWLSCDTLLGFDCQLRVCVVVKKRINVYTYFGGSFSHTVSVHHVTHSSCQ